ncbi:hypothetical protein D6825_00740 [Candidatus Woesearchaeota archaeon]|nr:MAG: hypothetical protein D6825_00740 [Candidatus Woesearchaeota archaeon]
MPRYIVEHLEPEVYPWCILEYKHASRTVGKENLLITNVKDKRLEEFSQTTEKSVKEIKLERACVLDPEAPEKLTPEKAKEFENFIFGGILGDNPPRARTKEELQLNYPRYNLGEKQMSTDTAIIVTHKIVMGEPLEKMKFKNGITINIAEGEEVQLPYSYLVVDGKPLIAPGLEKMLKEQESF